MTASFPNRQPGCGVSLAPVSRNQGRSSKLQLWIKGQTTPARPAIKAVILAGGFGTRISEASHLKPKPMIEIGGMPIPGRIMKLYIHHGITDLVICCGYKG